MAALFGPVHRDQTRDALLSSLGKNTSLKKKKAYLAYDTWKTNLNKLLERFNKMMIQMGYYFRKI